MRGRSYDSRKNLQRNKQLSNQPYSNTHFLSLQCILDKYQHENTMLSQQVKLLLNQNKRLKSKPGIDSFQQNNYGQRMPKKQFQNATRERSRTLYNFTKNINQNSPDYNGKFKDKFNYQIYQKQRKSSPIQKKSNCYQDKKSEKRYSYLVEQRNNVNSQLKHTQTHIRQNKVKNIDSQTYLKDSSSQDKPQTLNKQRKFLPTFNRQVYLDEETIFIDEDIQKLPCFVEASFGNIDLKISNCQNLQIKKNKQVEQSQIKKLTNQKVKQPIFKLERTQNQSQQIKRTNFKSQEIQKLDKFILEEKDKQNMQIGSCRKTNYPYIKNEFKISEPKTQLTSIFYPERVKQQYKQAQNKPKNCRDKKIFLNVLSKAPKKSMFAK